MCGKKREKIVKFEITVADVKRSRPMSIFCDGLTIIMNK